MTSMAGLHYVHGDQVRARGINLLGLPLTAEGHDEPIGELDGLLIDVEARRVRYLVVEAADTGKKHLFPLDATRLDPNTRGLARINSDRIEAYQPFDPSAFDDFDDEAVISLIFGPPAS